MRLTNELRKAINAAVRANVNGAAPLAEVGARTDDDTNNCLLWGDDDDLVDLFRLNEITTLDDDPANPGHHMLDLYVTTGRGDDRALETNVIVFIRNGKVIGATSDGRQVNAIAASLAFPDTRGW